MRLEKKDIETLLPFGIALLSKKENLSVKNMRYLLEDGALSIKAGLLYAGLPVNVEVYLQCFVKAGAIGFQFKESRIDSLLMKGDLLTFLKPLIKGHSYLCIEDDVLYFYHPKLVVETFNITSSSIELTFK